MKLNQQLRTFGLMLAIGTALAAPAAMASTVTFTWQTPTGLEIPSTAAPVTGTLVLNVTSQSTSGANTILNGTASSFSLSEGGTFATVSALPTATSWTYNTTSGILSTGISEGTATSAYSIATALLPPSFTVTATAATSDLIQVPSAVASLLAPALQNSTEIAFFAIGAGAVKAALSGTSGLSLTTTGTTGNVVGALGYFQVATAVPLPATLPLLLSGIGGLAALVRRRKICIA